MFIGASVINETQSIFLAQFRSIFADILLSEWTPSWRASFFSFLSLSCTCFGVCSLFAVHRRWTGLYELRTAAMAIACKVCVGIMAAMFASSSNPDPLFCAVLIFVNELCCSVFVCFFMLSMANLCDEQKAHRKSNGLACLSSMVSLYWALHALCAKPLNSLGPVLGSYVLQKHGYLAGDAGIFHEYAEEQKLDIKQGCFHLMLWFLSRSSAMQYAFWRKYNLFDKKLRETQRVLQADSGGV